jgi:translocator protein
MKTTRLIVKLTSTIGLLTFAGVTVATAAIGARSSRGGMGLWYRRLKKPPFQPPASVFPPVWTALYTLMAISAWRVWKQPESPERKRALALWGAQLAANGAWSWLFFGKRWPEAALADIGALAVALTAYTWKAARVDRPAAWLMAPYLAWIAFAGVLNAEIVRRNP